MKKNKKRISPKNIVITNILNNKKCPVCRKVKEKVIHFTHKDKLRNKIKIELLLCEDCCLLYKHEIVKTKDKNYLYLVPILNSMLKEVGQFEEKTVEQIQEEMEIKIE